MCRIGLIGCFLYLAAVTAAYAQEDDTAQLEAGPISFNHITVEDGLSQPDVHTIMQDRTGFLWFGTEDGLYRYDGHALRTFRPAPFDTSSIGGAWIVGVVPDGDGGLWAATEDMGLNRYDARTETFRRRPGGAQAWPEGISLWQLLRMRDGTLWMGTRINGLIRFDPVSGAVQRYRHDPGDPASLSDDKITALAEGLDGTLWIGTTDGGLNRLDPATGVIETYRYDPRNTRSIPADVIRALFVSRNGTLWVGTDRGLAWLDADTGHFRRVEGALGREPVTDMVEAPDGVFWVGTEAGLVRYDPATGATARYRHDPTDPLSLSAGTVLSLHLDRSGVLWAGTQSGLSYFSWNSVRFPGILQRPQDPQRLSDPSVWSFLKDRDGIVWIGTRGGLDRFDPNTGAVTSYRHDPADPASLTAGWVVSLFEEDDGTLWVGTRRTANTAGGLNRFDPTEGRVIERYVYNPADSTSLQSTNPWNLFEDSQGTFWVLSGSGCPSLMDRVRGTFRTVCPETSEAGVSGGDIVKGMAEEPDGVIWLATWGAGLIRYDTGTGKWTRYRHDAGNRNSPADDNILDLHRSANGDLWLATYGAGLSRMDPSTETFTHYHTSNSDLPNNVVYGVEGDGAGGIWVSSNQGLTKLNPATGQFQNYGIEHGLQDLEFNVASYAAFDGELFFGGIRGFNHFYPDSVEQKANRPRVVLTGLRVQGAPAQLGEGPLEQALPYTEMLRLSHAQHDVALTFAALDYTSPDLNRYRYRLRGYSDDWTPAGPERTATYTNLDPGTYTFDVEARTGAGGWNEAASTSLAIAIAPPWWQTGWAILLWASLALAAGSVVYRYRQRDLRIQRELEFGQLEAEGLRELDRAKSRFFANVSHEFRTPLTLTMGPLDDVLHGEYGTVQNTVREQLALARRNAGRVLDLINRILDVARLEAGRVQLRARPTDLVALVRDVAQTFLPLARGKRIAFDVQTSPVEEPIWADHEHLQTILTNLLSNAFKFTPAGGAVRVDLEDNGNGTVSVTVRDSGPGIPAADLPHVFERFYRADRTAARMQPGTGIGLALVRELVDLHGGTIVVESDEGFGSRFIVTLQQGRDHLQPEDIADGSTPGRQERVLHPVPTSDAVPLQVEGDGAQARAYLTEELHAGDEDRTTVLVVDDNAEIRAYIRRHLEATYRVLEAANGHEGVRAAREHLPDLVISDVMMPGMDGLALLQALHADADTDFLPVVLLTARADVEDRLEGLEHGADAYLTKPFDIRELRARVENLITSRQRLRERFTAPSGPGVQTAMPDARELKPETIGAEAEDARFLERVQDALETHLMDESLTVEQLAEAVGVSRDHLCHKLKNLLGHTPSEVIRTFRVKHGARLLATEAGNVSEVAYAVGFKSVAHFSNCFKRYYGCRPSVYAPES